METGIGAIVAFAGSWCLLRYTSCGPHTLLEFTGESKWCGRASTAWRAIPANFDSPAAVRNVARGDDEPRTSCLCDFDGPELASRPTQSLSAGVRRLNGARGTRADRLAMVACSRPSDMVLLTQAMTGRTVGGPSNRDKPKVLLGTPGRSPRTRSNSCPGKPCCEASAALRVTNVYEALLWIDN